MVILFVLISLTSVVPLNCLGNKVLSELSYEYFNAIVDFAVLQIEIDYWTGAEFSTSELANVHNHKDDCLIQHPYSPILSF